MTKGKIPLGMVAAAVVLAIAISLLANSALAATDGILVANGSAYSGGQGAVGIFATDVTAPGLGAWTIDIAYDPAVLTPTGCSSATGDVCSIAYEMDGGATDLVRFTGADPNGLEGTSLLATYTFACVDHAGAPTLGTSDLEATASVFSDATVGNPQDIDPVVDNGTFTCAVAPTATSTGTAALATPAGTSTPAATALPPTGTFAPDSGDGGNSPWLLASVAGIAAAVIAGFGAMRVRARRA